MKTHFLKGITFLLFLTFFFMLSYHHVLADFGTHEECISSGCLQCVLDRHNNRWLCIKTGEGKPLGQIGGEEGFGPWGNLGKYTDISQAAGVFTSIISRIIGVMTIVAGIWFIFQFIIGAYGYMTAAGDQQKIANATKKITTALIGLVIIVAAYAIISLLGVLLGFEILHPEKLIPLIGPTK